MRPTRTPPPDSPTGLSTAHHSGVEIRRASRARYENGARCFGLASTLASARNLSRVLTTLWKEVRVSSQATSKAATEETRDRAERGSAVRGSDRATVVAEEDTSPTTSRDDFEARKTSAQLFVEYSVSNEVALAASYRSGDAATGVVHVLLPCVEHIAVPAEAAAGLDAEQIA